MESGNAAQRTARNVIAKVTGHGLALEASENDLVMLFTHATAKLRGYTETGAVNIMFPSSEGENGVPQGVVRLCLVLSKDVTVRQEACTQPVTFAALRQISDGTVMRATMVRSATYAVEGALVHVLVDLNTKDVLHPPEARESFAVRVNRTLNEEANSDWLVDLRGTAASDSDYGVISKAVSYLLSLTEQKCKIQVVLSNGKYTVTMFGAMTLEAKDIDILCQEMSIRLVGAWVCAERRFNSEELRVPTIALASVVELRSDVAADERRPRGRKTGRYSPYDKEKSGVLDRWLPWR